MRPLLLVSLLLLLAACEPAVTSTYVTGTVRGVSFTSPNAIGHRGGATAFDNDTVLITSVPRVFCEMASLSAATP